MFRKVNERTDKIDEVGETDGGFYSPLKRGVSMELTGCVFIAMNVNQIDEKEGELD